MCQDMMVSKYEIMSVIRHFKHHYDRQHLDGNLTLKQYANICVNTCNISLASVGFTMPPCGETGDH